MNYSLSDFCVYAHLVNNRVIYIGVGAIARAFDMSGRDPDHVAYSNDLTVQIWFTSSEKHLASAARRPLLRHFRPEFNRVARDPLPPTKPRARGKRRYGYVMRLDTRRMFGSAADAAAASNVHPTAMSQHLNGNPRYPHVKGMQFIRVNAYGEPLET